MSDADLIPLVEALSRARTVCIGDVMLDQYVYGRVDRVSPEAPIPVLRIEREESSLGGAGNVLRNLIALGTEACFVSVTGSDIAGRDVGGLVAGLGNTEAHVLAERGRQTTVKTRYIAGTQQLLRTDREAVTPLKPELRKDFLNIVRQALTERHVLILSDYAKGVLADGLAGETIALARELGHIVVVDPKGTDYSIYRGANLLKPNRRELAEATQKPVETDADVASAARGLIAAHGFEAILVSLSDQGLLLVEASGRTHKLPTMAREVYDVSGAGDTLIAVLAAALSTGASFLDAARLANIAAGIVVGKVGTAAVHASEIIDTLIDRDQVMNRKELPLALALDHVARWRKNGLTIGFTNGCFDLLHPGHISLLRQARAACDRLIVGLNSDTSVSRLKGVGRPVQNETARATVLASLAAVDLVIVFEEDTPVALIEAIKPDVLIKGADYSIDRVVGADFVQSYGGKVMLAEIAPGHSTTATITRMAR